MISHTLKRILVILTVIITVTVSLISTVSLIIHDGGKPLVTQSIRGESVELYGGEGLYRYDTVDKALMNRAFDLLNLLIGLPLLILGLIGFLRDKDWAKFLFPAILFYFSYNYIIGLFGNAYNEVFLAYTTLLTCSLTGFILSVRATDYKSVIDRIKGRYPRRSLSVYMILAGIALLAMYLSEIIPSLANGHIPKEVATYTTYEIAGLDIAVAIPIYIIGGILLLIRLTPGYVIATLFSMMTSVTFSALVLFAFIRHFDYGIPSQIQIAQMGAFLLISLGFTIRLLLLLRTKRPTD